MLGRKIAKSAAASYGDRARQGPAPSFPGVGTFRPEPLALQGSSAAAAKRAPYQNLSGALLPDVDNILQYWLTHTRGPRIIDTADTVVATPLIKTIYLY